MDDIKLFAKNKKELETPPLQKKPLRIFSLDIRMEFGTEKCTMLIMRNRKSCLAEGIELSNQEKNQNARRKRKLTNTYEYWKRTSSNKWR